MLRMSCRSTQVCIDIGHFGYILKYCIPPQALRTEMPARFHTTGGFMSNDWIANELVDRLHTPVLLILLHLETKSIADIFIS